MPIYGAYPITHFQGKRMSDFIRETNEEKLSQMEYQEDALRAIDLLERAHEKE